jgi:uncharacterized repeat protein (TIGR03803 family)
MKRLVNALGKPNLAKVACALFLLCATSAIASPAETFTTLVNFNGTNGANPYLMSLVQGEDGNLYGTTSYGGAEVFFGTVFKMTPTGRLTTLYSFCAQTNCTDGASPEAGLVLGTDDDFYGTTGGANGFGSVFKITSGGTLTTLHSFGYTDGASPAAALVQATDGNFYGTTSGGGPNFCDTGDGCGTVFKITPSGTLTTLYSFCSQSGCTDGFRPAGLIQSTNGDLYGTTFAGGANSEGTVFKISPTGTLTTLYSFCSVVENGLCADGAGPVAALTQATNGSFYGTTAGGGANDFGTIFSITSGGELSTLHSFDYYNDGADPQAALVQATNGTFCGTAFFGGVNGDGTVFCIDPGGSLTTLHSFDGTDGTVPLAALLQATNGTFYGTTNAGGANNGGTIFSLGVGLRPFVKTDPTSGEAGAQIKILGTNLTGATNVSFSGVAAIFRIVSGSLISATVPDGAATGFVTVNTPRGTLKSNVKFRVRP